MICIQRGERSSHTLCTRAYADVRGGGYCSVAQTVAKLCSQNYVHKPAPVPQNLGHALPPAKL